MTITAPGLIPVVAHGTPVPLSADPALRANRIVVSQNPSNTGAATLKYLKNGPTVVRAFLAPAPAGPADQHTLDAGCRGNLLVPADWAVDAANNGEGLLVYFVTV